MPQGLIGRYVSAAPRYTSYPTAPHFHAGVKGVQQAQWLAELAPGTGLSVYCHIPFCDTLCWFCGCHTKHTRRYAPVADYLVTLKAEIARIAALVPAGVKVRHIHWGGGSPTILTPDDIVGLAGAIRRAFDVAPDAEFSVEIDPRDMTSGRLQAFREVGVNRASIGVQDFDIRVQDAINRHQSFDDTARVMADLRAIGIGSVNVDLLYGLPHQTVATVEATVRQVMSLRPDRIALFGYAHVPWMKKHQTMIDEEVLPDAAQRLAQSQAARALLIGDGYQPVGIDHFALPGDSLAAATRDGSLRRNFQGYTADPCEALIGLGASAISQLPQGYIQNETVTALYRARVDGGGLAAVRGVALGGDDEMRRWVIERLMCDFRIDGADLATRFGPAAAAAIASEAQAVAADEEGLFEAVDGGYAVTEAGRPYVRAIAACFDAYLGRGEARHSIAV